MASNPVIDRDSDNPDLDPVVFGLSRRRAELAGLVNHLELRIAETKRDIAHLDAVLAMFGMDAPYLKVRTRMTGTAGLFHRGELPRACMKLIRESENGLTSAELAFAISRDKAWDTNDRRFQVALADKITKALGKLVLKGRLVRREGEEAGVVWVQVTTKNISS